MRRFVALAALAAAMTSPAHAASEAEKCSAVVTGVSSLVKFDTFSASGTRGIVQGVIRKPPGAGPFPAVVILHRYFGIEPPECFAEDQHQFASRGWISLVVDSNSAPWSLRAGSLDTTSGYNHLDQAVDALAAKAYLTTRPDVDTQRIVLLGHAYGGTALLRAVSADRMAARLDAAPELSGLPFLAAVA